MHPIYNMMSFFKKLFEKKKEKEIISDDDFTQDQYDRDYELKQQGLENVLGKMHNTVGHAVVPFYLGGSVDLYYFSNHIDGTGIATMELLDPNGNGPKPNRLGTYELVAFTREPYNTEEDSNTAFKLMESRICNIFTAIGNYSFNTVLNPNSTYQASTEQGDRRYIIFDNYTPENKIFKIGERNHHLLLCMDIFSSELDFAKLNGSNQLFTLLKKAGHYPYSDLNRESVA